MTHTLPFPKPIPAPPKPRKYPKRGKPPARRTRPRNMTPAKYGNHREKVKFANDLWRHLIYRKEPSKVCPRCRKRPWVEAAHCWTKGGHPALRFELTNGAPLCRACHRLIDSDHHAKEEFFRPYMGHAEYERMHLRASARGLKLDMAVVILFLEAETAKAS
jgi:hypothetical protein